MKLVISAIPPSNNRFIGRDQKWTYQEEKRNWHRLVALALGAKRPPKPIDRARVAITYFFPDRRRRDPDNYAGKMLLDPLVQLGVLRDDSFAHVELHLAGSYDKAHPRTEIEVEETEP